MTSEKSLRSKRRVNVEIDIAQVGKRVNAVEVEEKTDWNRKYPCEAGRIDDEWEKFA